MYQIGHFDMMLTPYGDAGRHQDRTRRGPEHHFRSFPHSRVTKEFQVMPFILLGYGKIETKNLRDRPFRHDADTIRRRGDQDRTRRGPEHHFKSFPHSRVSKEFQIMPFILLGKILFRNSERIVPSLAERNFLGRKFERADRRRGTNL